MLDHAGAALNCIACTSSTFRQSHAAPDRIEHEMLPTRLHGTQHGHHNHLPASQGLQQGAVGLGAMGGGKLGWEMQGVWG